MTKITPKWQCYGEGNRCGPHSFLWKDETHDKCGYGLPKEEKGKNMKARIVSVIPNYIETGIGDYGIVEKTLGTWDVELILTEADGLTFEQAHEYVKNQTEFHLIPID